MKKLFLAFAAMIIIAGCDNRQAEIDAAKRSSDSLASIINERDSSINGFLSSFNEIESNLDSVAKKQDAIKMNIEKQGEMKSNTKDRINANIAAINEMMNHNRKKIAELNRKIKSGGVHVKELEKMIATLNDQLAAKDTELVQLNERLSALNTQVAQLQTSVDTLTRTTVSQKQTIDDQISTLHTAYYVVGKSKDLQTNKVINRTGGLLGIGKTTKLSSNVDNSKFTKVDYTAFTTIPINSKTAKIITTHPADSYTLNKEKDNIVSIQISNPDKFWSASKYLVVIKN